jgi:hypothetical protein
VFHLEPGPLLNSFLGTPMIGDAMRDFPDAVFAPEAVEVMGEALDASVSTLPHPVTSRQVNLLAESILRTAKDGERDTTALQRIALLELQLTPRSRRD